MTNGSVGAAINKNN